MDRLIFHDPMTPTLRPSLDADLSAITAIYAHAVLHGTASFELEPPAVGEMARRRATLLAEGFPFLVAERDGRVLGYAYAGPYRGRPAYRSTVEDSIYVAADARGLGIGRALLTRLIADATALDFRLMVAVIGDEASHASIALHHALGFEPVGILRDVGYKHGRWLATVLMRRRLGVGPDAPPTRPVR